MVILIGGEKGGTGKSSLATNLAALRASAGRDVLLVDTDKQMTASYWAATRGEDTSLPKVVCVQQRGRTLHRDLRDMAARYEDVIIDAGGQDSVELRSAMVVAEKLVIPMQASQPDLWTMETMEGLVDQARGLNPDLDVSVVINRGTTNPRVSEVDEARACLADYPSLPVLDHVVRERVAFRKAMALGRGVGELPEPDAKAHAEVAALYQAIYDEPYTPKEDAHGTETVAA